MEATNQNEIILVRILENETKTLRIRSILNRLSKYLFVMRTNKTKRKECFYIFSITNSNFINYLISNRCYEVLEFGCYRTVFGL